MAIENSSFWPKKNKLVSLSFLMSLFAVLLASCQVTPKHELPAGRHETPQAQTPAQRASEVPSPTSRDEVPPTPAPTPAPAPLPMGVAPKIGLILGPGALRSYAHVGVVQEFVKQRMPIQAVAGIEMGALVAAIYANKGQPYDVEWQMMKLKESDILQKALLSSQVKAGDVRSLKEFMNIALSSSRAENAKVAFACPALQIEKQQVYMMNKGVFADMLPYCLAFPPLFKPHQQNVAGVLSLRSIIDYLRSKGATYIVYVDLLSGPVKINGADTETQILWSLAAENLNHQEKGLDYVVHVPLKDVDLLDFNRRREVIQKGQQAAVEAAPQIMKSANW